MDPQQMKKLSFNYSPYIQKPSAVLNSGSLSRCEPVNGCSSMHFKSECLSMGDQSYSNDFQFLGRLSDYKNQQLSNQKDTQIIYNRKLSQPSFSSKPKIDFTEIIDQLCDNSYTVSPLKDQIPQFARSPLLVDSHNTDTSKLGDQLLRSQEQDSNVFGARENLHEFNNKHKYQFSGILQDSSKITDQSNIQDRSRDIYQQQLPLQINQNNSSRSFTHKSSKPSKVKVSVNQMIAELDDLQKDIKNLETNIDNTANKQKSSDKENIQDAPVQIKKSASKNIQMQKQKLSKKLDKEKQPKNNRQPINQHQKKISWDETPTVQNLKDKSKVARQKSSDMYGGMTQQSSIGIEEFRRQTSVASNKDKLSIQLSSRHPALKRNSLVDCYFDCSSHSQSTHPYPDSVPMTASGMNSSKPLSPATSSYFVSNLGQPKSCRTSDHSIYQSSNKQRQSRQQSEDYTMPIFLEKSELNTCDRRTLDIAEFHRLNEDKAIAFSMPDAQRDLLQSKIKMAEHYKKKAKNFQREIKKLKAELKEKDVSLANYQKLGKEFKVQKDQYKISEGLRNEQKKQMILLQDQNDQLLKENNKLRKRQAKIKIESSQDQRKVQNGDLPFMKVVFNQKPHNESLRERSSQ